MTDKDCFRLFCWVLKPRYVVDFWLLLMVSHMWGWMLPSVWVDASENMGYCSLLFHQITSPKCIMPRSLVGNRTSVLLVAWLRGIDIYWLLLPDRLLWKTLSYILCASWTIQCTISGQDMWVVTLINGYSLTESEDISIGCYNVDTYCRWDFPTSTILFGLDAAWFFMALDKFRRRWIHLA